eukprot:PhM_4_TR17919/c0_g1_i1/m.10923
MGCTTSRDAVDELGSVPLDSISSSVVGRLSPPNSSNNSAGKATIKVITPNSPRTHNPGDTPGADDDAASSLSGVPTLPPHVNTSPPPSVRSVLSTSTGSHSEDATARMSSTSATLRGAACDSCHDHIDALELAMGTFGTAASGSRSTSPASRADTNDLVKSSRGLPATMSISQSTNSFAVFDASIDDGGTGHDAADDTSSDFAVRGGYSLQHRPSLATTASTVPSSCVVYDIVDVSPSLLSVVGPVQLGVGRLNMARLSVASLTALDYACSEGTESTASVSPRHHNHHHHHHHHHHNQGSAVPDVTSDAFAHMIAMLRSSLAAAAAASTTNNNNNNNVHTNDSTSETESGACDVGVVVEDVLSPATEPEVEAEAEAAPQMFLPPQM